MSEFPRPIIHMPKPKSQVKSARALKVRYDIPKAIRQRLSLPGAVPRLELVETIQPVINVNDIIEKSQTYFIENLSTAVVIRVLCVTVPAGERWRVVNIRAWRDGVAALFNEYAIRFLASPTFMIISFAASPDDPAQAAVDFSDNLILYGGDSIWTAVSTLEAAQTFKFTTSYYRSYV